MLRRSTLERARSFHRPGRARAHHRHAKDGSSKVRERGWQPGSRRTVWAKVARQVSRGRGVIEVCPLPCLARAVPPQCTCDGSCLTFRRRGLQKCSAYRTAVAVAPLAPPRSVPGADLGDHVPGAYSAAAHHPIPRNSPLDDVCSRLYGSERMYNKAGQQRQYALNKNSTSCM
jgi:hypothetical protein